MTMLLRISITLVCSLLLASTAGAQLASQTALVGTVTDSGGGVMPGAQVLAVNLGTKDTFETTTNDEGYFQIPFVRPGRYEITVTLQGFQTFKTTGVEVATNQVVRTNATLQPGGVAETVNVEARAQVLNTDSATIAETIGETAIEELPLNGRNVWNLATTTPGVLNAGTSDIGQSFRGAGQREIQNGLSLDGISASSNLLAMTSMRPISDAMTEVSVQTGSTSAEYGSYLGVHINVVTKSGTNDLHGAVWHFYQGDALDSRGYFDNPTAPKNPRERNQFSFQADGPLVLPFYDGHNKTFFMAAYEGVAVAVAVDLVCDGADGADAAGQLHGGHDARSGIRSPTSRSRATSFPVACSMPTSLDLLAVLPRGEPAGAGVQSSRHALGDRRRRPAAAARRSEPERQNTALRPLQLVRHLRQPLEAMPVTGVTQPRVNHNTLVSYTHTLRPDLHNDFRIGYHRIDFDTLNYFSINGVSFSRRRSRHSRLRRRRAVQQPRHPEHQHQQLFRAGRGRHELVPVRHDLPDVERAGLHPRIAQRSCRLRSAAAGDRTPSGQRPARPLRLHRRHERPFRGRFHARPARAR